MATPKNEKEAQRIAESLRAWAASADGEQKITAALQQAREVAEKRERSEKVDPERLRTPVTV